MPIFTVDEHFQAISKAKAYIKDVRSSEDGDDLSWNQARATAYIAALFDLEAIGSEDRSLLEQEVAVAAHGADGEFTPPLPAVAIQPGLYAVEHINNWDGEGSRCTSLAQLDGDGHWTYEETGAPVLEHVGDEVLWAWPLTEATALHPYESLSAAERIKAWDVELGERVLEAFKVGANDIVAAKNERQALELLIWRGGEGLRPALGLGDVVALADHELDRTSHDADGEPEPTVRELLAETDEPEYLTAWQESNDFSNEMDLALDAQVTVTNDAGVRPNYTSATIEWVSVDEPNTPRGEVSRLVYGPEKVTLEFKGAEAGQGTSWSGSIHLERTTAVQNIPGFYVEVPGRNLKADIKKVSYQVIGSFSDDSCNSFTGEWTEAGCATVYEFNIDIE